MRRFVLTALLCSLAVARASANAPEDMLGVSSRVSAMGGAGTAVARDPFSTYYNPATLARCPDNQLAVDIRNVGYGLHAQRTGADAPADSLAPLNSTTRIAAGACLLLPSHFSAGVAFSTGLENQASIRMYTGTSRPQFPLYGLPLEHININAAVAYRPVRQVSIGVGASVLASLDLPVIAYVPVLKLDAYGNTSDVTFDIGGKLSPRVAPYLGVLVEPTSRFRIGLTYRAHMSLRFTSMMGITTDFFNWNVAVPMMLSVDTWYSPHQLALGAAGEPTRNLTVTGDVTWYGYNELRHAGFPFLVIERVPGTTGTSLDLVGIPNPDSPNYRSAWAFRAGVEGRVLRSRRLALRGGYMLRTSALPSPGTRNTTLLDGTVHAFTAGLGYAFNVGWDESSDSHDQPPPDPSPPGRSPRSAAPAENEDDSIQMTARFDAYARLSVMPYQTDAQKELRWGGNIFDAGLTMTLGWR